jgi:hypothetical protein
MEEKMVLENSETPKTKVYKIFRDGYIAGRALGNPRYEFDITSEQSCIYCFENWKNKHIAEENMATDEQVVKAINDILKILQPLKDQYDKKGSETLKITCERCAGDGTRNATGEKCDWCNGHGWYWRETKSGYCGCGRKFDTNDNQQVEAKMCQTCLDSAQ